MGDEFEVKVEDLTRASVSKIKLICDYCDKEFYVTYNNYIVQKEKSIIDKDCCKECSPLKLIEINQIKYGVNSTSQIPEIRQKQIETLISNYGVDNPMKSKELVEKLEHTCLERYGVKNACESDEIKRKAKQTNLDKLGVEFPFQSKEIVKKVQETHLEKYGAITPMGNINVRNKLNENNLEKYGETSTLLIDSVKEKARQTLMKNYGVDNPFKSREIQEKIKRTLFKNGTAPSSKQQEYLCNIFNGKLNYPIRNWSLDIAFIEEKIYIEYNGGGHNLSVKLGRETQEEFNLREIVRNNILKREGWKRMEIISDNDCLPRDEILFTMLEKSKNIFECGRSWVQFDVLKNIYRYKDMEEHFDYGKLRRI